MSAGEIAARALDRTRRSAWARKQVRPGHPADLVLPAGPRPAPVPLPPSALAEIPEPARQALLAAANQLLEGRWEVLGVTRHDLRMPDWFLDPISGRRAPQERYAFRINHRSERETGNVKQVWELSRHHHLTVLSAAWYCTEDDRYAAAVDRQLRSWWKENPFLSGVHWTSGIELGVRLIAWAWIRRLLDGWSGAADLFERNDDAARQLYWHQMYLAAFRSRDSSANNHVIAEAAGQSVASCAFPWFPESERWRVQAAALLERELERNTFPSGLNRELASDYHGFVAELALVAAVEADASGCPLGEQCWTRLCRMVDGGYSVVDERLRPPRQGDGDDGRALVLDGASDSNWSQVLASGASIFGALSWWPSRPRASVGSTLLTCLAGPPRHISGRPSRRSSHFADAGLTLLRTAPAYGPEIWCRCDGGPHGYLSIAAHAHADALSVEVRHGGIDILADPGTFCYHGEPEWRAYFRSTLGHNTLELEEQDQSQSGGPFLWLTQASTRLVHAVVDGPDGIESWSAEHDGYRRLEPLARHRRTVHLDRGRRQLEIIDRVDSDGTHSCRLAFHLGPSVRARLKAGAARLEWRAATGPLSALLELPGELEWTSHSGETSPLLGWYSPSFGRKQPTITLLGVGTCGSSKADFISVLTFDH